MELEPEYYQDSFSYVRKPMGLNLSPMGSYKIQEREKASSKKTKPSQPGPMMKLYSTTDTFSSLYRKRFKINNKKTAQRILWMYW